MEGEDALEDEDVGAVHRDGLRLPAVAHEVVDRDLDLPTLLQPLQGLLQQVEVKGVLEGKNKMLGLSQRYQEGPSFNVTTIRMNSKEI